MNDLVKKEMNLFLEKFPGCICSLKQHFKKFKNDLYNFIMNYTSKMDDTYPFHQRLYWVLNNIQDFPKCKLCGQPNKRKLKKFENGYSGTMQYCSHKCCVNSESCKEKRKETNIEKYGVEVPAQNAEIVSKIKETCRERYGSTCYLISENGKKKISEICLNLYGNEHYTKTDRFKNEMMDVWKSRTNEEKQNIVQKSQETKQKRYNNPSYNNREKYNSTMIERYGVEIPIQNEEIRKKIESTNILKYGSNNIMNCDLFREKSKQTCLDRYGVEHYSETKEFLEKSRQTCLEKYGSEHYSQSDMYFTNICGKMYDNILKSKYVQPLFDREFYIKNYKSNLKWKCKRCGCIFESKRSSSLNYLHPMYVRCEKCYPVLNIKSARELDIFYYIKSLCSDAISGCRDLIHPKEVDIYLPSKKIAFEFDGLYWHSNQNLGCDIKYHIQKTLECEKRGVQLIHIFEDEYYFKKNIVFSRIKNILGIYDNIIYARKCNVRSVSPRDRDDFLNSNHIQGTCHSKYNYGLYYNNELVSIMTFGGLRIALGQKSKENEYELLRFCNKLGYHIPGAASRLLKHFIRDLNPNKIISYADRRWSSGNLYKSIGFTFVRNTVPNYWYIISGIYRQHRFGWRKDVLKDKLEKFDPNLTEYENMLNNGYDCIYDCGNMLFKWEKKEVLETVYPE